MSPALAHSDLHATSTAQLKTKQAEIIEVIDRACQRIAPLWPLDSFVAVNPFIGMTDMSFEAACAHLNRVSRRRMLMPRSFYRKAIADGNIKDCDLELALAEWNRRSGTSLDLTSLKAGIDNPASTDSCTSNVVSTIATVSETLDGLAGGNRRVSRTAFMIDEISKWCAGYFDLGQAGWPLPWRHLPPYQAWRQAARFDRNPEAMGIANFRKSVAALPQDPVAAIWQVLRDLMIPEAAYEDYLHRALLDIGGWAAYARYRVWISEMEGRSDDTLIQLLAIRVVWGYALYLEHTEPSFRQIWRQKMERAAELTLDREHADDPELVINLILQEAYEHAYQRKLIVAFTHSCPPASHTPPHRRSVQAAFCIDVRSEIYRRALETILPDVGTIGFAGFFGMALNLVPIGQKQGRAQCPVLIKPTITICEAIPGATEREQMRLFKQLLLKSQLAAGWNSFKRSAVSCFTYVETAGLLAAWSLVADATTWRSQHAKFGDERQVRPDIRPSNAPATKTGIDLPRRLELAEGMLRAMSLTEEFARLVLLVGHGSTTVNNPHAAGLNCGACGGHSGDANARVAAAVLNDPEVRQGLTERGIHVPSDCWFLAGLHNTTTDEVALYDLDDAPSSHRCEIEHLQAALDRATILACYERAIKLGIPLRENVEREVARRSRDWSQVRPEWGLAGNAAFIAASRERTHCLDLSGRAFLHSYNWQKDHNFSTLEQIMTAPMVVASWINLQYYGSTVNNSAFGSGNKVLHNIVGKLGVLEGNGGDLRTGLPWQSIHDGRKLMHEPLRLNVIIEAPLDAINSVIAKHDTLRQLTDNHWLHLFALGENGRVEHRYLGECAWQKVS
ncbi:MAG: DUF2309 domain-containing protein [Alphaproteobacteria bacterium]|nr:DUF2309 domain-containing protein [Alphaproteobacteria bacterium]